MSTRSYIIAGGATLAIVGWFAVNSIGNAPDLVDVREDTVEALPAVVVRQVSAEPHPLVLTTYGRTRAHREVGIKARTAGTVVSTPLREGARVRRGAVVCRQDVDARQAVVDQARAAVAKAEADLRATEALVARGFKSSVSINTDRASLDAARAQLSQAETELGNIVMRAPFAGVFDEQVAELGDYLAPGQTCGTVVELDPLVVEAELTETQVGKIALGQTLPIALASGEAVEGTVSFVESRANPATRTFGIEADVPNADFALKAGVSATVDFVLGEVEATPIPASILSLNDAGETGVRYLDADNSVRFATVETIDETERGIWVTGLPSPTRVIVEGQDFVSTGTRVDARTEGGAVPTRTSPVANGPVTATTLSKAN